MHSKLYGKPDESCGRISLFIMQPEQQNKTVPVSNEWEREREIQHSTYIHIYVVVHKGTMLLSVYVRMWTRLVVNVCVGICVIHNEPEKSSVLIKNSGDSSANNPNWIHWAARKREMDSFIYGLRYVFN